MNWLTNLWASKPEAIFAGGATLVAALIGAWAALRAARRKPDPTPPVPAVSNAQTGQQGGAASQARDISGTVNQTIGANPTEIAHAYAEAMRQVGALQQETQRLRAQLSERDGEAERALTEAVEEIAEEAETAADPDPFRKALAELATGHPGTAEDLLRDIVTRRKAEGEAALMDAARAARHIGAIAFYHDTRKALDAYQQAVALDPGDPDDWNQLGRLKMRLGDLEGARTAYEKVLSLGNRASDNTLIAIAYGNLGLILQTRGELDAAERMHRKSLALSEELGRKDGMALQQSNLGLILQTRGELDAAQAMHRKALALHKELGRKDGIANAYGNLGVNQQMRGELDTAEKMHRKALALHKELGRKEGIASDYGNLGLVLVTRGDLDKAEAMHRKALALEEELGRKEGMAREYGNLGMILQVRGDLDGAEAMLRKSLSFEEELGRKEGIASDYANLGLLMMERGRKDEGCHMLREAIRLFTEIGAQDCIEQVEGLLKEHGCPDV